MRSDDGDHEYFKNSRVPAYSPSTNPTFPPTADHHFCKRGERCWPTDAQFATFKASLNQASLRSIYWNTSIPGNPIPKPDPLVLNPVTNIKLPPLGGAGIMLEAAYAQPSVEANKICFSPDLPESEFCALAVRNNPIGPWSPAFIVFPATTQEIQRAVVFAKKHNLKVCVTATGHDFLNRHSCDQGMMIRTGLLKTNEWDLVDKKGFGWVQGNVKFGTGVTWQEVANDAKNNNRLIASGWCATVGIAGWHFGGGYGPFTRKIGLGVDNILEVEMVLSDGVVAIANAKGTTYINIEGEKRFSKNADLFWAVRGGGPGFGIVAHITVRAHTLPSGGVTYGLFNRPAIDNCQDPQLRFDNITQAWDEYIQFITSRGDLWSAINGYQVEQATGPYGTCVKLSLSLSYGYLGSITDPEFQDFAQLTYAAGYTQRLTVPVFNMLDFVNLVLDVNPVFDQIVPVTFLPPTYNPDGTVEKVGAWTSVLVPQRSYQHMVDAAKMLIELCQDIGACYSYALSQGMPASAPTDSSTSVNNDMRNNVFHLWINSVFNAPVKAVTEVFYELGNHSYFGESAYLMENWQHRYWGNNYARLLAIKKKFDPKGVFTCHHCVGDNSQ